MIISASRCRNTDPITGRADFTIRLKQSTNLLGFDTIPADPARLSVDGQGRIVYEVDAPTAKLFYLMKVDG